MAVTTLDSDGPLIAMSYSSGIEIKQKNGALFNSVGTITTTNSCTRIEFANVDDDAALELICTSFSNSYYNKTSDIIVYDFSAGITEQFRFTVEGEITDFVFVPERNSILAGVTEKGGSYYSAPKASITEFSLDARGPIWSSAPLIGEISHRSIYYRANPQEGSARLMFATNYAMYLVQ